MLLLNFSILLLRFSILVPYYSSSGLCYSTLAFPHLTLPLNYTVAWHMSHSSVRLPPSCGFFAGVQSIAGNQYAHATGQCLFTAAGCYAGLRFIIETFIMCAAARPRDVRGGIMLESPPIYALLQPVNPLFGLEFFKSPGFQDILAKVSKAEDDEVRMGPLGVRPDSVMLSSPQVKQMSASLSQDLISPLKKCLRDHANLSMQCTSAPHNQFYCTRCGKPNCCWFTSPPPQQLHCTYCGHVNTMPCPCPPPAYHQSHHPFNMSQPPPPPPPAHPFAFNMPGPIPSHQQHAFHNPLAQHPDNAFVHEAPHLPTPPFVSPPPPSSQHEPSVLLSPKSRSSASCVPQPLYWVNHNLPSTPNPCNAHACAPVRLRHEFNDAVSDQALPRTVHNQTSQSSHEQVPPNVANAPHCGPASQAAQTNVSVSPVQHHETEQPRTRKYKVSRKRAGTSLQQGLALLECMYTIVTLY